MRTATHLRTPSSRLPRFPVTNQRESSLALFFALHLVQEIEAAIVWHLTEAVPNKRKRKFWTIERLLKKINAATERYKKITQITFIII